MYFLNNDSAGLLQVYRLERDGHAVHQITFEPASVDSYDISPKDGSLVYASNNQLLLVDVNGAGRRLLLDGGPLDDNNRFTNGVGMPVWSPDGQTIAFNHGGLNFYSVSTGAVTQVLQNQIDTSSGFPVVHELYAPLKYAPDGSKLLISIGFYESGHGWDLYPIQQYAGAVDAPRWCERVLRGGLGAGWKRLICGQLNDRHDRFGAVVRQPLGRECGDPDRRLGAGRHV